MDANREHMVSHVDHIKTYSERMSSDGSVNEIRRLVEDSSNIIFLGFGYHSQNMKIIRPEVSENTKKIFATGVNISDNDIGIVAQRIKELFGKGGRSILLELRNDLGCFGLFSNYWWHLSSI